MKNTFQNQVIGIPIISESYRLIGRPTRGCLPDPATQYQISNSVFKQSKGDSVLKIMNKFGKKADNFAQCFWEHVRLGSNISETVKGKLNLGAKILQFGGVERIFKELFRVKEEEKLVKASQCYLSTTAGPIAGLLFISTHKIAFCSERSIKFSSPNGKSIRAHYKVLIPLTKIKEVNKSENMKNPSQKYMEIVTIDEFDFWFMGFLNYDKTFKCLQQAAKSS
ncbi:GRAM domain-containing protein / ABA-responsive protein-related [Euphorbia peplus]|nr:GRAM domain-containing protein / ABA-responsive protein-related [Euphorbia peplus]